MTDGEAYSVSSIALGVVAGASYEMPVGSRVSLVPSLWLRSDLLSRVSQGGWRAFSATAGLSVMIALSSTPTIPPQPLDSMAAIAAIAAVPPVALPLPTLTASIRLTAGRYRRSAASDGDSTDPRTPLPPTCGAAPGGLLRPGLIADTGALSAVGPRRGGELLA